MKLIYANVWGSKNMPAPRIPMKEPIDTLLTAAMVVTMNAEFELIADGGVAVRGSDIVAVGPADELRGRFAPAESHHYPHHIIMPGLVNAHTHLAMTLMRGLNDDLRLDVWLGYLMPIERQFVDEAWVRLGTKLGCAELIRSGVTSFADMYYFEEAVAEETAAIGLRALLGQTVLMFPAPDASTYEDALARCRRFIEGWNGHELIQPAVSPHAWYTATPELLRACVALAKEYDVPLHTHIAETEYEVQNCTHLHDMNVTEWNDEHGILGTKLLAAHCVHITRPEMKLLQEAGAGVAHCPTSNLKLGSGIAAVAEMQEMGLKVGIGTDSTASNNDLDMFEELRLAALLAKVKRNDPTDLPARDTLALSTMGGARALHMGDKTGSLEVGKHADLIVVSTGGAHNWPQFNHHPEAVYSRLVYATKSGDVQDVMCHGRWLMRDRILLTVDEAEVTAATIPIAQKIDAFVRERESSPYNKLLALGTMEREEGYEAQMKVQLDEAQATAVRQQFANGRFATTRETRSLQYDNYLLFDTPDVDANKLRFREDAFLNAKGEVREWRTRLTLLGEAQQSFPNQIMLSRSRFWAAAHQSLRFYREYFTPQQELEVHKERQRWVVDFGGVELAINLDQILKPKLEGYFLEIKARTWSRPDAEQKAKLIEQLLAELGVAGAAVLGEDYTDLVD